MIPILERSRLYASRTAIIDVKGTYTYADLRKQATPIAEAIAGLAGSQPGPVLFLVPSGFSYVVLQWGIWMAGGIAVPVHTAHPADEIAYLAGDTNARLMICDEALLEKAKAAVPETCICVTSEVLLQGAKASLPTVGMDDDAMMIYTSGTTGRPKGVVMSHRQLDTQMRSLSEAWAWQQEDRILNILPMHHVHGVINITCCALYNGALLEMLPGFDAAQVAARMGSGELTLFMAVPTIYHKLAQHFEQLSPEAQGAWQKGMRPMRLMVSGSAALPVTLLEQWRQISGHTLLERYGMTEIGMALSNPLQGRKKTRACGYAAALCCGKAGR